MNLIVTEEFLAKIMRCRKPSSIAICLMVLLSSALSWSADAKGYWREGCSPITTFYLTQSRNSEREEIAFQIELPYRVEWLPFLPDWKSRRSWKVNAKRCTSPDKCEDATKASFQFQEIKGTHATGSYQLEFSMGDKAEGTFVAKFRPWKPRPICE